MTLWDERGRLCEPGSKLRREQHDQHAEVQREENVQHALVLRQHARAVLDEFVARGNHDLAREHGTKQRGPGAMQRKPGEAGEDQCPDCFADHVQTDLAPRVGALRQLDDDLVVQHGVDAGHHAWRDEQRGQEQAVH
jgi:hypothetical protein